MTGKQIGPHRSIAGTGKIFLDPFNRLPQLRIVEIPDRTAFLRLVVEGGCADVHDFTSLLNSVFRPVTMDPFDLLML